jgi:hypothetical protein
MRQSMTQGQGLLAGFWIVGRVERQMLKLEGVSRGLFFRKASDEAPFMVEAHRLMHCDHNPEAIF